MMRLVTMGELTEGPDQMQAGRGFVVSRGGADRMRSMIRKARCILADLIAPSDHRQSVAGGPRPTGQAVFLAVRPEAVLTDDQVAQLKDAFRRAEQIGGA